MFRAHKTYLAFIFAATLLASSALAEEPSVTAVLTRSQTVLGRPVQLQIKITGSPSARPPDVIDVDGLEIRYMGQSQMIEGRNFQFSYSFVYNYSVTPERTGTFRIPPQKIQAGSNALRTPELTLNVADAGTRTQRSGQGASSVDAHKLVAAELVLTKTTAYVGELIPAEVRLYINSRTRANIKDGPEVAGQGFTMQKLSQATQSRESIGGQYYDVFTFKTAIAAARTGKFEIGPVKATATVLVPRQPAGGRSPFDIFNMDDPFSDPFFADPFGHSLEREEVDVESKPVTLDVKPLPPNAPPDFSGAIGNFTLDANAKPKSVQVGDPITVTANISGRGNFDRVSAPTPEDEHGWHQYPPSSNFKQDDDVGISGTKTFETVLTPNEPKKAVPPLVFSFFDPVNEKYVTLRSDAIPVKVEGEAIAAKPEATAATAQAGTRPGSAPPATEKKADDILYQFNNWPGTRQSFAPIYTRPNFWWAQIIPLVALLGFLGWKWRQSRLGDRAARRRADLQHEAAEVQRRLRRSDAPSQEYYAEAARAVQLKTALAKNVNPNTVDAGTAAAAFRLDDVMRGQLETLFKQKDELRYSGGANGEGRISPNEQREVLELIEHLRV